MATDQNFLTDIKIEPIFVGKIAISRLSSPHPYVFYPPFFAYDQWPNLRHETSAWNCVLFKDILPPHRWQLSGTFGLGCHLRTPEQVSHICDGAIWSNINILMSQRTSNISFTLGFHYIRGFDVFHLVDMCPVTPWQDSLKRSLLERFLGIPGGFPLLLHLRAFAIISTFIFDIESSLL